MTRFFLYVVLVCGSVLASLACGNKSASGPPEKADAAAAVSVKVAEDKAVPYTYPPPVKGHFQEANTGDFDLVDGAAYRAKSGEGTVVYVTSKPIASPMLADSACPMTQARALTSLRDSGWVEVTLDAKGKSKYFAHGTAFAGSGRETDVGGRYWSSRLEVAGGKARGDVRHKDHGGFEFDLPVYEPRVTEVSEGDRVQGRRSDPLGVTPTQEQVVAAYQALRKAALARDLKALLQSQGFDEKQVAAIRGLEGIDTDFAVYADRFLQPGTPGEFQNDPGYGAIAAEGVNSKGAKFVDFYWFAPCRDKLVLTSISENPQ